MKLLKLYLLPLFLFSAFFLFSVHCNIGTTYDSGEYEAAAVSFHSSGKLMESDAKPYVDWPPLYPVVLSFFTNQLHDFATVLNLFCLLVSMALWIRMAEDYLAEYLPLYGVLLALSTSLLLIGSFLWSESLFLLLLSVYVKLLQQFCKTRITKWLILASLAGFFMLLTRTVGVTLGGGAAIAFAASYKEFDKREWSALLLHFVFVVSGLLGWLIYTGSFTREDHVISYLFLHHSVYENILTPAKELSCWLVPGLQNPFLQLLITALVLGGISIGHWVSRSVFTRVLIWMIAVYCAVFIFLSVFPYDIGRYMAVLYPPIILLLLNAFKKLVIIFPNRKRLLVLILIIWMSYPLVRISYNALRFHRNNCGTSSTSLMKF